MRKMNENHIWFSEFLVYPTRAEFPEFDREFRNFRYAALNINNYSVGVKERNSIISGFEILELMILRLRMELDEEIDENVELREKIDELEAHIKEIEG